MALGGSKRVPRKNIKLLGDRPLIAWTIDAAKGAKQLDYFLVSTNDEEIAKISKNWGAPVPFKRPAKISQDVDTVEVLKHAVLKYEKKKQKKVSYVVCLQPTSPLRTSFDIDECVRIAKTTGVDSVISWKKVAEHPYWMFQLKAFGHEMEPYTVGVELEGDNLVSQNLPVLFYPNGAVYVTKRDVIMDGRIFGKSIYGYIMPPERSIDLEEELDFVKASAMLPLSQRKEFLKNSWLVS